MLAPVFISQKLPFVQAHHKASLLTKKDFIPSCHDDYIVPTSPFDFFCLPDFFAIFGIQSAEYPWFLAGKFLRRSRCWDDHTAFVVNHSEQMPPLIGGVFPQNLSGM
jgi:hypothetical protein